MRASNKELNGQGEPTGGPAKIGASPQTPARWLIRSMVGLALLGNWLSACTDRSDEAAQFFLKGNVQLQKREYREAIRFYSEALDKKPDFADAYNNRGLAKFRNDDREGALADYTRAIEADPDYGAAYLNRAEARLDMGDAGGSLDDLQRIEKQYADSAFFQVRVGDAHVRLNEPARAQVAYDKALRLSPDNVEALTNRGALFFSQKQFDAARADIGRALQLDPRQDAALNNQSLLLAQAGRYAEALPFVERALAVRPNQPYYLNNRAYLLLELNRTAEVLPIVQESLRLDNQNAWAHRTLGLYYLRTNQPKPAVTALQEAERLDPSVDALYYYLGQAERAAGNSAGACAAWERGKTAGDTRAAAEFARQCGR